MTSLLLGQRTLTLPLARDLPWTPGVSPSSTPEPACSNLPHFMDSRPFLSGLGPGARVTLSFRSLSHSQSDCRRNSTPTHPESNHGLSGSASPLACCQLHVAFLASPCSSRWIPSQRPGKPSSCSHLRARDRGHQATGIVATPSATLPQRWVPGCLQRSPHPSPRLPWHLLGPWDLWKALPCPVMFFVPLTCFILNALSLFTDRCPVRTQGLFCIVFFLLFF